MLGASPCLRIAVGGEPRCFFFCFLLFDHFYLPAQLLGGFTLSDLLDKPRSQVSSLLPPGTCLQFLSRIGFSIPTARRFSSNVARKSPHEYVHSVRIELAKLILVQVGTRITYQATGDAGLVFTIEGVFTCFRTECGRHIFVSTYVFRGTYIFNTKIHTKTNK